MSIFSARRTGSNELRFLPALPALLGLVMASCYSSGGFVYTSGDASGASVVDGATPSPDGMVSMGNADAASGPDSSDRIDAQTAPPTPDGSSMADVGQPDTSAADAGASDASSGLDAGRGTDLGADSDGAGAADASTVDSDASGDDGSSAGADGAADGVPSVASPYTLVFFDEFDGNSLDRSKWCTRYVYAGGPALQIPDSGCTGPGGMSGTLDFLNDEQQRYVDLNAQNEPMHVESGGILSLRATKTGPAGYAAYESAMIRSKFEFKPTTTTSYYIAARLRLPNVVGTWPALWLNGGYGTNGQTDWPPEIDIFEGALNGVEDTTKMLRIGSQVRGAQTDSSAEEITYSQSFSSMWDDYYSDTSLRDVWLDIRAVWTAQSVCYFVGGVKAMCENYHWNNNAGLAANPASLLLNLAIGGGWAGRHGIDDASFPATLDADYVRVYSFAGQTAPTPLPP